MVKRILALLGLAILIVVVLAFGWALHKHKVASDGDLNVVAGADEILFLSHDT